MGEGANVTELASARLLSVTFLVFRHENRFMSDDRIWNMLCQNQNQNQNSLLVKRQIDNTTPGGDGA